MRIGAQMARLWPRSTAAPICRPRCSAACWVCARGLPPTSCWLG